jgi:hypothetical protein
MPYIKDKQKRALLNNLVDVFLMFGKIHGRLNYFLNKLCIEHIKETGESYANYKEMIAELEMAKLEIYRIMVSKYEDKKIIENGEVE